MYRLYIQSIKKGRVVDKESEYNKEEIRRAVEILGSVSKLARALALGELAVYKWLRGQSIPDPINCLRIQKATNGQVKARDIRPNYDWDNVI